MSQSSCGSGFSDESAFERLVLHQAGSDHLERHRAAKSDINCLVSNAHRTSTKLDRFSIPTDLHFEMRKTMPRRLGWGKYAFWVWDSGALTLMFVVSRFSDLQRRRLQ